MKRQVREESDDERELMRGLRIHWYKLRCMRDLFGGVHCVNRKQVKASYDSERVFWSRKRSVR